MLLPQGRDAVSEALCSFPSWYLAILELKNYLCKVYIPSYSLETVKVMGRDLQMHLMAVLLLPSTVSGTLKTLKNYLLNEWMKEWKLVSDL